MNIQLSCLYVFAFVLLNCQATAQSNFRPGSVTLTDSTVIQGFIRINNWNTTPLKIAFKKERGGPARLFAPPELLGFTAEEYFYKSALVQIETSPTGIKFLNETSTLNLSQKHIFLQQLLAGPKSLFIHRSKMAKENFYLEEEGQFTLLKHKRYLQRDKQLRANKTYVTQLAAKLSDCPYISQTISRTSYNKKELVSLLRKHADCTGSKIDYEIKRNNFPITFGILAGVAQSHLSFEELDKADYLLDLLPSKNTIDPTAGIFINISLPFDQKKWSIHNEVLITNIERSGSERRTFSGDNFRNSDMELKFTHFKMNHFLQYTYRLQRLGFLINGGVSHAFLIDEVNFQRVERKSFNLEGTDEGRFLPSVRPHELGTVIGTGIQFDRWSLQARYEFTSQVARFQEFQSRKERLYLLLGFRF